MIINIDFTKKEREMNKSLREELRKMPADQREKYHIRNNKIVLKEDSSKDNPEKKVTKR